MTYTGALDYLYNRLPMYQRVGKAAYKDSLENSYAFDRYLDYPHGKYKTIHVAGTNGKGSVCHILASVLQEAGYIVGLHTSPHMIDFRERMKINGIMAEESFIAEFVTRHKAFLDRLQPSFFEISVFMAFEYFAMKHVDVAIVEVGMGGRLDSTNVICPELSVITNIGLDHTGFLGDTLEKIAAEKAGIIKEGVQVVIGETNEATKVIFEKIASERGSDLVFADQHYHKAYSMLSADGIYQIIALEGEGDMAPWRAGTDLLGSYQSMNIITVLSVIDQIGRSFPRLKKIHIERGFRKVRANTSFHGRWEIVAHNPLVVCDSGHNAAGISQVVNQLINTPCKTLHIIIGFVQDKDFKSLLSLFPRPAVYYFTRAPIPRALDEKILQDTGSGMGLKGQSYSSVSEAYKAAMANTIKEDLVFIGGSTFIVADFFSINQGSSA